MITTTHLIEQLSKFPQGARIEIREDFLVIQPPAKGECPGVIDVPAKGRPKATRLGGWKGWMDNVFHTAGGRIQRFLLERPAAARCIAFSAVAGLYLEEDEETALHEDNSYPRGDGADYVDEVGAAIVANGLQPLIEELLAEVPEEEEEDEDA